MKTPAGKPVLHTPFRGVEMGWSHAMKKPQKGVCTPARAVFIHVFGFGSRGGRVRAYYGRSAAELRICIQKYGALALAVPDHYYR
jgi:hypothetical protein